MWRHCAQGLALVGLDGFGIVKISNVIIWVDGNQDVCNVCVDFVLVVPAGKSRVRIYFTMVMLSQGRFGLKAGWEIQTLKRAK